MSELEFIWKKYAENMHPKLVASHYLILINDLKYSQCIQENLLKIKHFKDDYQKSSKNLTSILFSNPVLFYINYYEKQESGTSCNYVFVLEWSITWPFLML